MKENKFFKTTKKYKQMKLLNYIEKNPEISQKQLANKINVSKGMLHRYFYQLLDKDYINTKKGNKVLTPKGKIYLHKLLNFYSEEIRIFQDFLNDEINNYKDKAKMNLNVASIKSMSGFLLQAAKDIGISNKFQFNLDIQYYDNGQNLIENFAKQDYDIGLLGVVPAFLWQSTGTRLIIEAEISKDAHAIISNKNITNLKALNHKTILIPQKNESVSDNLLKKIIREKGLDIDRIDLKELNICLDNLLEAYSKWKKFNAILLWEPYMNAILNKFPQFKVLYDFKTNRPHYISNVLIRWENDNKLSNLQMSVIKDMLKETIQIIKNNPRSLYHSFKSLFGFNEEVYQQALNRITFKYQKWED